MVFIFFGIFFLIILAVYILKFIRKRYFTVPVEMLYIHSQSYRLMEFVVINWVYMFFLGLLSFNPFIYFIIPLWLIAICLWVIFGKIWRSYGYSLKILNLVTVLLNIIYFFPQHFIREHTYEFFGNLIIQ